MAETQGQESAIQPEKISFAGNTRAQLSIGSEVLASVSFPARPEPIAEGELDPDVRSLLLQSSISATERAQVSTRYKEMKENIVGSLGLLSVSGIFGVAAYEVSDDILKAGLSLLAFVGSVASFGAGLSARESFRNKSPRLRSLTERLSFLKNKVTPQPVDTSSSAEQI